jgi:serine/threonine protein kinase
MTDSATADLDELARLRLGTVLAGKWRLDRVLGSGGMATVYAATHCNNGRAAAIKLLHSQLAWNAEIRRRFSREGYIANKVGHPGAVEMLDDGIDDQGSPFLVMDLLSGQSLHERQKSAPGGVLSAAEVLFIADGVLDVLVAAHEQGIVHRDLKPDNVLLTTDGAVKVLDFGIAHLVDSPHGEKATQTGLLIGTPSYMPQEQARGYSKLVSARSDLWSLGAILFTLLTGRRVHEGETPNEMLLNAMTARAPQLGTILPAVNRSLARVIDRALSYEPDDRWRDARAMQEAVREARAEVMAVPGAEAEGGARRSVPRGSLRSLPTPITSMPMVTMARTPSSGAARLARVALVASALAACALGATLLAPAKWRRLRDRVTALAPALTGADAGLRPAHEVYSAPSSGAPASDVPSPPKSDAGAPHGPSVPRPRAPSRSRGRP